MHPSRCAAVLAGLVAAGCHTYSPDPVDLEAHAEAFAQRVPDGTALREFVERLRTNDPTLAPFDLADGLDRREARCIALLFHPELRAMRLRADVARASADHAGLWEDPELHLDFAKILETVEHPWVVGGAVGLTLPITGRPGLERELADSRHGHALVEARIAEARVLRDLDLQWARWSTARLAADELSALVERLTELERVANRLAGAQLINHLEARTFTLERTTREVQLVRARSAVAADELALKQLLGLPPERPVAFVPAVAVPLDVGDAAQRRAGLTDGPRTALARAEHEVADRQFALAIRKQWPELTLLPGFQEEDGQPRAALGFSLPLPLWNANAQQVASTRAERARAAEALRGSLETAVQELALAEVRHAAARDQRHLVETQLLPLAEQQLADGRRLVDLGRLDTLLILDALTRSHEATTQALDSALAEAEATVAINALFWPTLTAGTPTEAGR
jgi:outer membrane protein TolC